MCSTVKTKACFKKAKYIQLQMCKTEKEAINIVREYAIECIAELNYVFRLHLNVTSARIERFSRVPNMADIPVCDRGENPPSDSVTGTQTSRTFSKPLH